MPKGKPVTKPIPKPAPKQALSINHKASTVYGAIELTINELKEMKDEIIFYAQDKKRSEVLEYIAKRASTDDKVLRYCILSAMMSTI